MSSGQIFLILLIISGAVCQRGYKRGVENVWMRSQNCDVIIRDLTAEITSPRYPKEYPSYSDCHYTILPSNEAICQVSINFLDFDVEGSPSCFKDKLLIGDEPFCGRLRNYRISRNLTGELKLRFVSDSAKNGRFRLRVEQIHCGNSLRYAAETNGECCGHEYGDPYFVLTSPGFLATEWTRSNCRYTIHPSSPSVCRLRFRFKHFWVGDPDDFRNCPNGYLEIDKGRFCGCMDGYEYVSSLDETRRKELGYSYEGPGNRGFVIEVFQEECPFRNNTEHDPNTEIEVFTTNMTSEKAVSRFLIPRDGCRDWGHPEWTRSVVGLIASAPCRPVTASQFYPFSEEPFPPAEPFPSLPEPAFPPLTGPAFPPQIGPDFPPPPPFYQPGNRQDFFYPIGKFSSPNYPNRYPPNMRLSYRFFASRGYCRIRFSFLDFNLEKSFNCWKDYIRVYGNKRFCGHSLHQTEVIFDFDPNGVFIMDFVSDWCFSGRGFLVKYTQLPCSRRFARLESGNSSQVIADK